jgi:hypothetical protein
MRPSDAAERAVQPAAVARPRRPSLSGGFLSGRFLGGRPLAVLVLTAAAVATWLLSGVGLGAMWRWVAYEALYVAAPGCALYVLLSRRPGGWLRVVAIGWPLGYAVELGAFALTGAVGARGAFVLLPLLSPLAGIALVARGDGRARVGALLRSGSAGREAVMVALAAAGALVVLTCTFFASSPLPERARSVSYSEDNIFDISLAAEARHHWPITTPWVAGEPLHYYKGVFMHTAAVNQVTGVSLGAVILRFLPSTLLMITALQLWALGGTMGRSRWIGPLAVLLLLVLQDVNLNPTKSLVLYVNPFSQFSLSPSFGFGVPLFLAGLLLLQVRFAQPAGPIAEQGPPQGTLGLLALTGALVAGLTAAKAFGAFDLVGGLGLYWLWRVTRERNRETLALTLCLAVAGVAALIVYVLMIAGGGAASLGVHPLAFVKEGNTLERATKLAKQVAGGSLYWLPLAGGAGVLAVSSLAPLLGAGWALWKDRGVCEATALPLSVFLIGVASYVLLGAPGGVEGVFFVYGYVALVAVAAKGLVGLWGELPPRVARALARACGGLLALGLAIAALTPSLSLSGAAQYAWYAVAYGTVVGGGALAVWKLQGRLRGTMPSVSVRIVACCIPLVSALALVKPLTLAGSGAWKTLVGKPTSLRDTPTEYGMTAGLYQGLEWVRAHTTPCDVLAVNNHYDNARREESVYFYYSAFTERRVYLESWRYTAYGQSGAQPYPAKIALNDRAVARGEPAALRELARKGVSYVLIDKSHVGGPKLPASASTLVFANAALDVYRLPRVGPRRGCAVVS